jgi:hypothetical protein
MMRRRHHQPPIELFDSLDYHSIIDIAGPRDDRCGSDSIVNRLRVAQV